MKKLYGHFRSMSLLRWALNLSTHFTFNIKQLFCSRKIFLLFCFINFLLYFFHYHLGPLYPPPNHDHHSVIHESFFLFAQSLLIFLELKFNPCFLYHYKWITVLLVIMVHLPFIAIYNICMYLYLSSGIRNYNPYLSSLIFYLILCFSFFEY